MVELDLKIIEKALENHELADDTISSIMQEIIAQTDALDMIADIDEGDKNVSESEEEQEEKPPRKKKQFNIIVSDPEGKIPNNVELTGWVVQQDEDENPTSALTKIYQAVYDFNATSNKKYKLTTIGDACMYLKNKFFKNAGIIVKTKEPVYIQITNNQIPTI